MGTSLQCLDVKFFSFLQSFETDRKPKFGFQRWWLHAFPGQVEKKSSVVHFLLKFSYYSVSFQWLFWKLVSMVCSSLEFAFVLFVWIFFKFVENLLNMKSKANTRFFSIWNKLDMWLIILYRKIMKVMFWRWLDCRFTGPTLKEGKVLSLVLFCDSLSSRSKALPVLLPEICMLSPLPQMEGLH